ncbi:MAG TPA: GNAT family N-acetyltransferase [Gaiellaceae bacterium]|nr:GNAT family N-acetyltransferase [Gaiellaceae bacterium]
MDFEVLDSIERIAPEWDELATRAAAPPFARPGWFQVWWRAFGRGRLELLAARRGARLVGVAPLSRHRGSLLALANVHSPRFTLLSDDEEAELGLAERLFDENPLHTVFCYVEAGVDGVATVERVARSRSRRLFTAPIQRSPYVELDGDWDGFEHSLSSKFVADLRRRRRALEREGEVGVEVVEGAAAVNGTLSEVFALEPSGWKDERGTAITASPATRRFYTELAEWAAAEGFLRLAFLRLDGRPLACQYALEDAGGWYFLKGGIAPDAKRFAPGKLLAHAMIRRAYDSGLRWFEFLGAAEAWKSDWRPAHRDLVIQHSFPRGPVGLGWSSAVAAWRLGALPLAKRILRRGGR